MDSMIKKWKKLINNEKTNKNDNEEILNERSNSRNKNKSRDKSKIIENDNHEIDIDDHSYKDVALKNSVNSNNKNFSRTNKFKYSIDKNSFNASYLSNNNQSFSQSHNKFNEDKLNNSMQKNYKKTESISKSKDKNSLNKNKEKSNKSSLSPLKVNLSSDKQEKQSDLLDNLNSDKILRLLYKILNSLPKSNMDSLDIKNFSDDLNETINLYIKKLNSLKESKHAFEQKEIILQTKCNTAERMIKEYEVKYLAAEKEKVIILNLFQ
jgi:hypothetical protein